MPCNNAYISSLRSILTAFAYYSISSVDLNLEKTCTYQVGYCQSLNFVVGMLLLVFATTSAQTRIEFESGDVEAVLKVEEKVFWVLVALVELILPPEMYGHELKGAKEQQQILWNKIILERGEKYGAEDLKDWYNDFEALISKCTLLDEIVSPMETLTTASTPWFLSLFVNIMPPDVIYLK